MNNNKKNLTTTTAMVIALLTVLAVVTTPIMIPMTAMAQFQQAPPQPQQQQEQQPVQQQGEMFESEDDGFRLQVPQGWVIEDFDNIQWQPNYEDIALLCLESESLPGLGGESNCLSANITDAIAISRLSDLMSLPEFQNTGIVPTTDDLTALAIQALQYGNQSSNIQIINNTDLNEFTKIVNMTWTYYDDARTPYNPFDDYSYNNKGLFMLLLAEDRNTGYIVSNSLATPNLLNQTEHSPAVTEVFDTFEIVS